MTSNSTTNSYESEYQKILFQDDQTDLYKTTNILRKLTGLSYNAACQQKSNDATCYILEEHLQKYTTLVDQIDENKINNYSDFIFKIASNYKNESKNWKTNLKDPEELIKEHLKVEKCPINNENECANRKVTKDFLKKLHTNYLEWEKVEKENNEFPKKDPALNINQKEKSRLYTEKERNQFPNFYDKKNYCSDQGQSNSNLFLNEDFSNDITSFNKAQLNTNNNYDFNQPSTSKQNFQMRPTTRPFQPKEHFQFKQNSSSSANFNQNNKSSGGSFKTARDELNVQNQKKWGRENRNDPGANNYSGNGGGSGGYGAIKRNLGTRRAANINKKFQPPIKPDQDDDFEGKFGVGGVYNNNTNKKSSQEEEYVEDERLRGICPKMIEMIRNEIMDTGKATTWDDIAGLEFAKETIKEIVVFPMLRPDIFTGLRTPAKGILLFGPPGTGKTLIGKCIASHSHSTFFNISASSLTSKWIGDGEKMVRALFSVARVHQPSVVFIDEIDSLLTQRSDTEHESSRRIKTEFLVQLDGAATSEEDRILIIGATNRPQELDEAARRRMVKRLYIPLPTFEARKQIIERLLSSEKSDLTPEQIDEIAKLADGYSGADMKQLCAEASLGPIRSIGFHEIQAIKQEDVRPVNMKDFLSALKRVRSSVSPKDLESYVQWNNVYGTEAESVNI